MDIRHRDRGVDDARQGRDVLELLERGRPRSPRGSPRRRSRAGTLMSSLAEAGSSQVVSSILTSSDIEHHAATPGSVLGTEPQTVERDGLPDGRGSPRRPRTTPVTRVPETEISASSATICSASARKRSSSSQAARSAGRSPAERSTARSTASPSPVPTSSANARSASVSTPSAVAASSSTSSSAVWSTKRYISADCSAEARTEAP